MFQHNSYKFSKVVIAAGLMVLLASCSSLNPFSSSESDEDKLPGERISILKVQGQLEPEIPATAANFSLPDAWENSYWPQSGGYPDHAMRHLVLSQEKLSQAWSRSIGSGNARDHRLTSQPIVADSTIFTIDSNSRVSAFKSSDGRRLWYLNIRPKKEDRGPVSGGIAFSEGKLFATNGFGQLLALDAKTGKKLWHAKTGIPAYAAPTVSKGRVFVTTIGNSTIAYAANDGTELWRHQGAEEVIGMIGMPSPAVKDNTVYVTYTSGEIYAIRAENGNVAWSDNLSGLKSILSSGLSRLRDVQGEIVVDQDRLFVTSTSGRVLSIDARTGRRIWERDILSVTTPWVADNFLFITTLDGDIAALTRSEGKIRWVGSLNKLWAQKSDDKVEKDYWYRPILAGQRLVVVSRSGKVLEMAPANGEVLRHYEITSPIAIAPIVAKKTLYILDGDGDLVAYR